MTTLFLASASPRRLALLQQLGYSPLLAPTDIDETPLPAEEPAAQSLRLAAAKAAAAARERPDALILAADTVVSVDGRTFGKPRDLAAAKLMLEALGGRWHTVHTAITVTRSGRNARCLSTSRVQMRRLDAQEMAAYWASGEPADKAGAYAIQGLGALFITALEGSYSGVMGLPLFETGQILSAFGCPPPFLHGSS
ncbi:MAG: Maf family nucleotide pyrophosphatase [Gammaproteobacteria bacterium]|nr:Maf family nucleotide pyrophosphatase [Gammaproteobacteria bacterium]